MGDQTRYHLSRAVTGAWTRSATSRSGTTVTGRCDPGPSPSSPRRPKSSAACSRCWRPIRSPRRPSSSNARASSDACWGRGRQPPSRTSTAAGRCTAATSPPVGASRSARAAPGHPVGRAVRGRRGRGRVPQEAHRREADVRPPHLRPPWADPLFVRGQDARRHPDQSRPRLVVLRLPVADGRHQMEVDGKPVECDARRVPAREAEREVVAGLMTAVLPPDAIEAVAAELRRRLVAPSPGTSDKERQRLRTRMEQLRKQNEWGDLPDTEYRRLRSEVEADLLGDPGRGREGRPVRPAPARRPVARGRAGDGHPGGHPERRRAARRARGNPGPAGCRLGSHGASGAVLRLRVAVTVAPPDGFEPPTPALGRLRSIH